MDIHLTDANILNIFRDVKKIELVIISGDNLILTFAEMIQSVGGTLVHGNLSYSL